MQIPIKIEPDNLKQSIVNIKFDASIPLELIPGRFHDSLIAKGYTYIPAPTTALPFSATHHNQRIEFASGGPGVFHNSKIKLQIVEPGHLIFTMFSSYIGWTEYFKNISEVLHEFIELKIVTNFKNIGLRYISEYVNQPIENIILSKFAWNIKGKEFLGVASHYKTEYEDMDRRVILNLASQAERTNLSTNTIERISVIDIDIIRPLKNIIDLRILMEEIDNSHTLEKKYFFGILSEEFVSSLNPIY